MQGEIVGLIGPNGSGKTTLFNCITGQLLSDSGQVYKDGKDITHWPPHRIALMGIARTFQNARVFEDLTTIESLLVAAQQHQEDSIIRRLIRSPSIRIFERVAKERAEYALEFVGLGKYRNEFANTLSYGQRKLLSFATTIVIDPEIVLLDEPAAAVNPAMINHMKSRIQELNQHGVTFLIVEHNMEFIMDLATRILVLDQGRIIAEGKPCEIQHNERVLDAYFGQ